MNMSHCRFNNTLEDLQDCYEYFEDELSEDETKKRKELIELCQEIAFRFQNNN